MSSFEETDIPKFVLLVINQLYSIEYKLGFYGDVGGIQKNVDCLKQALAAENLFFEDPMGQPFDESRADLNVSIAGEPAENMKVVGVFKPIIRFGDADRSRLIQKGEVFVRSTDASHTK